MLFTIMNLVMACKPLRGGSGSGCTPTMSLKHAPIPPGGAKHNFAAGSRRDSLVFGSSRPAFSPETEKPGAVNDEDVAVWAKDMQEQGIKWVVCLLNDDELQFYRTPLVEQLKAAGFNESKLVRTSIKAPNAADTILDALRAAEESGERIVLHCSGGAGRTSLGLGLWLTTKYNLTPEEAAEEIAEQAEREKVVRTPDAAKLANLFARATTRPSS